MPQTVSTHEGKTLTLAYPVDLFPERVRMDRDYPALLRRDRLQSIRELWHEDGHCARAGCRLVRMLLYKAKVTGDNGTPHPDDPGLQIYVLPGEGSNLRQPERAQGEQRGDFARFPSNRTAEGQNLVCGQPGPLCCGNLRKIDSRVHIVVLQGGGD